MEGAISVLSDRNIWDHLWRFANFGQSDRNVPFHLTKLMCPVPLFCFLLTRTITKRALAWVGSLQQECTVPMSTWNFRNFKPESFVEWKALMVYNNLLMCLSSITINHWSGLVPVPLLPRPSRSVHFGDVSKTLRPRDPKPIGRTIVENWKKKSLLTYKVSNTFMRLPNRVLQSRNLEPDFAQSRNPDSYFRNPVSLHSFNPESRPRFALKSRILSFK